MKKTSKAFSFVEIIISISIISLLSIILISSKEGYEENLNNTKIVSDIETINNAFTSYSQDVKSLPMPGGNINFYSIDTSYKHSFEDPDTFGVYGSITEATIPKKYLDVTPLDPRTNSYYAYGKTKSLNQFEVASVQYIDAQPITKVVGNYTAETGPYNLIREYNGPNFVYDKSNSNFPYNPDELVLIVTDQNGVVYREGDTINSGTGDLEIFYSDGSVSILEPGTIIKLNKLNFKGEDNLNSFVKIALGAGTIWTRATKLNDESSFEVYTEDTNASVRGTIFKVTLNPSNTDVTVIEGIVDLYKIESIYTGVINFGDKLDEIEVKKGENPKTVKVEDNELDTVTIPLELPDFTKGTDPRDSETVLNIMKENCKTLFIPSEGGCIQDTSPELTASGYQLVAYAPYNKESYTTRSEINENYLKLYDNNKGISSSSSFQESGRDYTFSSNPSYLMNEKGVFIDNINVPDFIKYDLTDLELGDNFAIEMRVSKESLIQFGTRYVFDNELNKGLLIYKNSSNLYTIRYNGEVICSYLTGKLPCNLTFENNFEKIIIKNGTELIIGGKKFTIGNILSTGNILKDLFIGSSKDSFFQLNGIIDYVKIYKK